MGLAYGAADQPSSRSAKRVAVIIGPDGKVKQFFPKVNAGAFPKEALELLG